MTWLMSYLIDGNNLIGHTKTMSLSDPACRQLAISRVAGFCHRTGAKATIVFDGGPDESLGENGLWLGPVTAFLAGRGFDADTRIVQILEKTRTVNQFTVVSSDRAIYGRARGLGFAALRIHEFNKEMINAEQAGRESLEKKHELTEKNRVLSGAEIDEWLKIFTDNEEP